MGTTKLSFSCPSSQRLEVPPDVLSRIGEHFEADRFLNAWHSIPGHLPLWKWTGTKACILGLRLASRLGSPRLSNLLFWRGYRANPHAPGLLIYRAYAVLEKKGWLPLWEYLESLEDLGQLPLPAAADLIGLKARVTAQFRDEETTRTLLARALQVSPATAWLWAEHSFCLQKLDHTEEALVAAEKAFALHPRYRPAVIQQAELLGELGRHAEAETILRDMIAHSQSAEAVSDLIVLLSEQERFTEMLPLIDLYETWTPLRPAGNEWSAARRVDALRGLGRFEEARQKAETLSGTFYQNLAQALQNPGTRRRRLEVPFVRQDHNTCAPATLAALIAFWGQKVPHDEISEAICYDGSYDFKQRRWLEDQGWIVREFRVDWTSTKALIDAAIPFAVVTSEPGSSHLQAVIGYDEMENTLLIRDPGQAHYGSLVQEWFFNYYAPTGPRGMAFVPSAKEQEFQDLVLPDAKPYDLVFQINVALDAHRREQAARCLQELKEHHPDNRLTWSAQRSVAHYDGDEEADLAVIRHLLALYPDDDRLKLSLVVNLRGLGRKSERLEMLESWCAQPGAHALFLKELAFELWDNASEFDRAKKLLRRAHFARSRDAWVLRRLADLEWESGLRPFALLLHRFACSVASTDENLAEEYFQCARALGRTDEGLAFLKKRQAVLGKKSPDPSLTLARMLDRLDLEEEALAVLNEAMSILPEEGSLMLLAAELMNRTQRKARAADLLQKARTRSKTNAWLRTASQFAKKDGNFAQALDCWKQLAQLEPATPDIHRNIASLLEITENRDSAIAHLRQVCQRYPYNISLHSILAEWLQEHDPEAWAEVCRHVVTVNPLNAWNRRELGFALLALDRPAEAEAECAEALKLEPHNSSSHNLLGRLRMVQNRPAEAHAAFRQSLAISIDNTYAIPRLLETSEGAGEKMAALRFVATELRKQITTGPALAEFRSNAQGILSDDEILQTLVEAAEARPDLWHAHSARINFLADHRKFDEAATLASALAERFPLTPGSWRILGRTQLLVGNIERAEQAFAKACELNSNWGAVFIDLSELLADRGALPEAIALLENAFGKNPLDETLAGQLAKLEKSRGNTDQALHHLKRAVSIAPSYSWAWRRLREWGDPQEIVALARQQTEKMPRRTASWMTLAECLDKPEEKIACYDRALTLDPRHLGALDLKATALAGLERYDEALTVCRPEIFGKNLPVNLRGREAWLEAQRGERNTAKKKMRQVLDTYPAYAWGWRCLADWHDEDQQDSAYLECTRSILRLEPSEATAAGYHAHALLKTGDKEGALEFFQRAHHLDVRYHFANRYLLDLLWEFKRFDNFASVLSRIRPVSDEDDCLYHSLCLALQNKDQEQAEKHLLQLFSLPEPKSELLQKAWEKYREKGLAREFVQILASRLPEWPGAPASASALVDALLALRQPGKIRALLHKADPGSHPASVRILCRYIDRQAESSGLPWRLLGWYLRYRSWFELTPVWGMVGYLLATKKYHRLNVRWLRDWSNRPQTEAWMLHNLSYSLRVLRRLPAAEELGRLIIKNWPTSTQAANQHLHLALASFWQAKREEGEVHWNQARPALKEAYNLGLAELGGLLRDLLDTEPGARKAKRKLFRDRLQEAVRLVPAPDSYQALAYIRSVRQVGRYCDSWRERFTFYVPRPGTRSKWRWLLWLYVVLVFGNVLKELFFTWWK